jgi:hypothetical protein
VARDRWQWSKTVLEAKVHNKTLMKKKKKKKKKGMRRRKKKIMMIMMMLMTALQTQVIRSGDHSTRQSCYKTYSIITY